MPPLLRLPAVVRPRLRGRTARLASPTRILGLISLLILFPFSASSLPSEDPIHGALQFSSSHLVGPTRIDEETATAAYAGWNLEHPKDAPRTAWSLHAEVAVVNWVHVSWLGIGTAPGDPDDAFIDFVPTESFGQRLHQNATVGGLLEGIHANVLMIADRGVKAHAELGTSASLRPASGQRWIAGDETGKIPAPSKSGSTWRVHPLPTGAPVVNLSSPINVSFQGSFVLSVWGGFPSSNVTVIHADGTHSYRTGEWWENATGTQTGDPHGLTRDEYEQFLEIQVTNGTFVIEQDRGLAQWVGAKISTLTNGTVRFEDAQGNLESNRYFYAPDHNDFSIEGTIALNANSNPQAPSTLSAQVAAHVQSITQPAAGAVAPPALASAENPPKSAASPKSQVGVVDAANPSPTSVVWWWAALLFAAGLFGCLAVRRRSRHATSEGAIGRAEAALAQDQPEAAVRQLRPFLQAHPRHVHAWFLYANALYRAGDFQGVVRDLAAVDDFIREVPSVALVLSHAYGQLGQRDEAERWRLVAERDPELARVMSRPAPPILTMQPPLLKRRRRRPSEAADVDLNVAYS